MFTARYASLFDAWPGPVLLKQALKPHGQLMPGSQHAYVLDEKKTNWLLQDKQLLIFIDERFTQKQGTSAYQEFPASRP